MIQLSDRLSAAASRLLAKSGEAIAISFETDGETNPATGEVITQGQSVTLDGFGYPSNYNNNEIDGTHVESGDVRLVLELLSERPQKGWRCNVDSKTYRIQNVRPIRESGKDVLYIVQLRQV